MLEAASVVIPSWNGAEILRPTLAALASLEEIEYEVLIVDHGRINSDTERLLADFANNRFRYLGLDQQLGYAGAVNYGVERAKNRLVAVLCNDVIVEKRWLFELVQKFLEREKIGLAPVVSSLVERPGFREPLRQRLNIWGRIVFTGEKAEFYQPLFPDGSAFLFDRNRFGQPFDADYFLYQEDVSLGLRAWLEGQEVVLARKACALNADGGTTKRTPYRTAFFTERNRWINIFTFFSALTLLRLLPLLATEAAARIFWSSNRLAKIHAWVWLAFHPRELYRKRRKVQARRKVQDADILEKISGSYLSVDSRSGRFVNSFWRFIFRLFLIPLGP